MNKIYRTLGKRGRTTIPYVIRVKLGLRPTTCFHLRKMATPL